MEASKLALHQTHLGEPFTEPVEDSAFESLKGYEPELMELLDLFSRSERESSCATDFNVCASNEDLDGMEEALQIPDLMNEGNSTWTEFLMDDDPNGSLFPFHPYDSLLPCDFLTINTAPQEVSAIQPSLPSSMFPFSSEIPESRHGDSEEPLTSDINERLNTEGAVPGNQSKLISQESSTTMAEIARQELGEKVDESQNFQPETPENQEETDLNNTESDSQNACRSSDQVPADSSASTQLKESPNKDGEETANEVKNGPKRKRVYKPKDPNAPKRKVGRPRVLPGLNCLKHVVAFEKDGGFAMGDQANLMLSESVEEASRRLQNIISQNNLPDQTEKL